MKQTLRITSFKLVLIMAIYFSSLLNLPLYIKAFISIKQTTTPLLAGLSLIPLFFFLFSLFISLFSILSIKYIEKVIYIGLVLISSILSFSYGYYGIIFNGESPLIGTIIQTNFAEIWPLITPSFLAYFILFGVFPSILIYKVTIIHPKFVRDLGLKILSLVIYPLIYVTTSIPLRATYHDLFCESGLAARTPFQLVPTNFAESLFDYYKDRLFVYIPYQKIGVDAHLRDTSPDLKKTLLVIVIGESARSKNLQWYGYNRPTNPYTKDKELLIFKNMSSCGTSTKVSVPCIFSSFKRKEFSEILAPHRDNLLNILNRAKINVFWIDNNGAGGCQGICTPNQSIILHLLDEAVLPVFKQQITKSSEQNEVVIIHLHGSHGPDYYTMYPKSFAKFTPECLKDDLIFCKKRELINSYDNSLIYTDFILNEIINLLQKSSTKRNTALIYTSDHGESLGEKGIYEHCTPYFIAPPEQKNVPLVLWLSKDLIFKKNISSVCLKQNAIKHTYSHDNLFHSILGIMDVTTSAYEPKLDLFKPCR